jgi:hypothetical protein
MRILTLLCIIILIARVTFVIYLRNKKNPFLKPKTLIYQQCKNLLHEKLVNAKALYSYIS